VRLREIVKNSAVVDVSQPEEVVAREVCDLVMKFYEDRNEKPYKVDAASGLER
jgi:hypothetical protein